VPNTLEPSTAASFMPESSRKSAKSRPGQDPYQMNNGFKLRKYGP
jgi:hypothetical protein